MWKEKVQQYEDQIINDLKGLLAIESVRDDAKASEDAPVGPGPEYDNKTDESIEKGKFDDEGGAAPNNNLRIVTEEDLKKNKNALSDKE
ncbi:putative staphylococcal protein [Staphylococcus aureus]|nr:putative staphylococcal protein [Staphylococcus aureus]